MKVSKSLVIINKNRPRSADGSQREMYRLTLLRQGIPCSRSAIICCLRHLNPQRQITSLRLGTSLFVLENRWILCPSNAKRMAGFLACGKGGFLSGTNNFSSKKYIKKFGKLVDCRTF